jgi:hypothetical protein
MSTKRLSVLVALVLGLSVCICSSPAEAQYVENGLIGYWTFNSADIDGDTAKDMAGDYDGTIMGNPQVVAGKVGDALQFDQKSTDGGGDFVDLGIEINKEMTGPFTVEGWFRFSLNIRPVENRVHVLLASREGAWGDGEGMLLMYNNNRLRPNGEFEGHIMVFSVHYMGTSWLSVGGPDNPFMLESERWYHITATFDGALMKTYFDGEVVGELANNNLAREATTNLRIAHSHKMGTRWNLLGAADEVRIYNRALDAGEVNQNLQAVTAVDPGDKLASSWGAIKSTY